MKASLSLDLDNAWSYLQVHGNPEWESYPSYLDRVVPIFLDDMRARGLTGTVFIVGKDAATPANRGVLAEIAAAGHEIGNHSFHHLPWLHRFSREELAAELSQAHEAIQDATDQTPVGFRGPGFSLSDDTLAALDDLGYAYDASVLPTFIGPLARLYYFRTADLSAEEREIRDRLFGRLRDVLRPNSPFVWEQHGISELPVTTMPLLRTPFHLSYLLWLAGISPRLADVYLQLAIRLCRLSHTEPSLLIHPLDFFGGDDAPELTFFPGMEQSGADKRALTGHFLDRLTDAFDFVTCRDHVAAAGKLRRV